VWYVAVASSVRKLVMLWGNCLLTAIRATKKKDEYDFKVILENLVNDLLAVVFDVALPAAELILYQLVGIFVSACDG
jgi:hypothetical protein